MAENNGSPAGSSFWQIIFPSLVFGVLIILIAVWVVIGLGDGDVGRFSEISTVLLVLPVVISSLILFVIFGAGIVLISRIMSGIPPITSWILEFLTKIQQGIGKVSEFIVQPVIRPSALLGGLRNILSRGKSRLRIE
jgi:hypothetical protein